VPAHQVRPMCLFLLLILPNFRDFFDNVPANVGGIADDDEHEGGGRGRGRGARSVHCHTGPPVLSLRVTQTGCLVDV
jgi:hypothetical protein